MFELKDTLKKWSETEDQLMVARVIKTWGSSPRPVGSTMLVNKNGQMAGSVSGGCVEGNVVKSALNTLHNKESLKLSYGVSDEEAWSVGLSCGGSIDVFLETINPKNEVWKKLIENLDLNKSSVLVSSLEDDNNSVTLIDNEENSIGDTIETGLINEVKKIYSKRKNSIINYENKDYFIQIFPRKSTLLIIGAAHITVDLVTLGNQFGFETIVIDPRGFFTKNVTFNDAPSRIIEAYPSEALNEFSLDAFTYAAVLSHDPKIDDNALEILLPSKVAYIGCLGSKKTHAKRVSRLIEKGVSQGFIDRIKAPIGVNIKAKTPKEIALSIMGQIIETKNEFA